jgi:hypothetical protein
MTSLSKNNKGYHTVALLTADLERAIGTPKTLRNVMSDFRDLNYYYGKLNIKAADLKKAAIALLTDLRTDLSDIESFKADKIAKAARLKAEDAKIEKIRLDTLSPECLQWLSYSAVTPGIIMVKQDFSRNGCDKWVTFASHAQIFSLLTGREPILERGYSKIEIPQDFIAFYELLIQESEIPLTFVYESYR